MSSSSTTIINKNSKSNNSKNNNKRNKNRNNNQNQHIRIYDHPGKLPHMGNQENKIYTYVQNTAVTYTLTQRATLETSIGFQFVFTDLDNYTNFAGLYDQYRIDEIEMTIRPAFNAQQPVVGFKMPLLYTVIDYDDAGASLTTAQAKEYANVGISLYETTYVRFRPHIATAAYSGASLFTSFANMESTWIDVVSTGVPHYGVKLVCEAGATGQTAFQYWDVSTKFKISFRNVK